MNDFCFPLIVAEGLDVNFYTSAEGAIGSIESVDVLDGVYKSYDALGNKINFIITDDDVIVIKVDGLENHKAELKKLLIDFLMAIGLSCGEEESLRCLLERCEDFYKK